MKGMASFLLIAILAMFGIYLIAALPATDLANVQGAGDTSLALAEARDALIGYAVSDATRPGELPCPDMNDDGTIQIATDYVGSNCKSYVGRLPWKTLNLPDLRDASGERLWYALSPAYHANGSAILDSDTAGSLTVYSSDGLTLFSSNAVAVIFSPGTALKGQARGSTASSCPSLGSSVAGYLCPDNYLDTLNCPGANCRSNASGPFVMGPIRDANGLVALNDTLIVIRAGDLVPGLEKRVARELRASLQSYFIANHHYPYPARYDHCDGEQCDGDDTVCRGRVPLTDPSILDKHGNPLQIGWPSWFVDNQWYREVYYSVGAASLASSASLSAPVCSAQLTVSGLPVDLVFFMPGTPLPGVRRPSNLLSDYLEDAENRDGWGADANDLYVIPTSKFNDRDRVYTLP